MKRLAILYICTGKYIVFWKEFYSSTKKCLLSNTEKHYFVFTDADRLPIGEDDENVHRIYQKDLGWPGNTLYRFRMFKTIQDQLQEFDYIYFFNANYVCLEDINEEEFLPECDELVVTLHPSYYFYKPYELPYDRNPKSTAHISYFDLRSLHYFCGGLNGGGRKSYLKLINDIDKKIEIDDRKGVIALWHDESHLNKYMLKQKRYKILSPSYACPEEWKIPFEPKLLLLEKRIILDLENRTNNHTKQKELGKFAMRLVKVLDYIKQSLR